MSPSAPTRPLLTAAALLACAATVTAHGFVESITVNGQIYDNYDPTTFPYMTDPPAVPGWTTDQQDLGFVEPNSAGTPDVICHRAATPGASHLSVSAGDTLTLQWTPWPDSHKGPVIDYLASCGSGGCESVDKTSLQFIKIAERGLIDPSGDGTWAADELIAAGNTWEVTIPSDIPSGNYVLRHEIIALHSAGNPNGAQLYPQCVNLEVSGGSGSAMPQGTPGTSLYTASDPGIVFNIYGATEYPIPGPPLYSAAAAKVKGREHARDVHVE